MSFPILTYHGLTTTSASVAKAASIEEWPYLVDADQFEAQLRVIAEKSVATPHIRDLIGKMQTGESLPQRAICLTFDDGKVSDYEIAFPLLKKYGLAATFFVVTDRVGKSGYVTWEHLEEMNRAGMSIESHSRSHPFLSQCSESMVYEEMASSKAAIESRLGTSVRCFAFPGGDWVLAHQAIAKRCGYDAICTSNVGLNQQMSIWSLERLTISRAETLETFRAILNDGSWRIKVWMFRMQALRSIRHAMGLRGYSLLRRHMLGAWRWVRS